MKSHINLQPQSVRRRELLRRRARKWAAIWLLAASIALIPVCGRLLYGKADENAVFETRARRQERLASAEMRLAQAQDRLHRLRQEEAILSNCGDDLSGLVVLAAVSACAKDVEGDIRVESLSLTPRPFERHIANPVDAPALRRPRLLNLHGMADNNITVAGFASALRDTGVFTAVTRTASESLESADGGPVSYSIECKL